MISAANRRQPLNGNEINWQLAMGKRQLTNKQYIRMKKQDWNHRYFSLLITYCLLSVITFAQTKHKVAIFAPLYLDSAFDDLGNYRYDKQFPKFINPGLEFYEGAQLALDTLTKEGAPLEVFV